jgi:hypothetical protein
VDVGVDVGVGEGSVAEEGVVEVAHGAAAVEIGESADVAAAAAVQERVVAMATFAPSSRAEDLYSATSTPEVVTNR